MPEDFWSEIFSTFSLYLQFFLDTWDVSMSVPVVRGQLAQTPVWAQSESSGPADFDCFSG